MLISKVAIRLVDPGKEAFEMARRACFGCPRRGPGPPQNFLLMTKPGPTKKQLPEPLAEAIWSMWSQVERKPRMQMKGDSMSPFIKEDDLLVIDPQPEKIRFGDIVVYRHNGKCIAHRVVGIRKSAADTRLLLKGDNIFVLDPPISRERIMGKVSGKENASGIVDYTSRRWLFLNTIIAVFSRLSGRSRILFRILRRLRRLLLRGFRNYK